MSRPLWKALKFFFQKIRRVLSHPHKATRLTKDWYLSGSVYFPLFFALRSLIDASSLSRERLVKIEPLLRFIGFPASDLAVLYFFQSDFGRSSALVREALGRPAFSRSRVASPVSFILIAMLLNAKKRIDDRESERVFARFRPLPKSFSDELLRTLVHALQHTGTIRTAFDATEMEEVLRSFGSIDSNRFRRAFVTDLDVTSAPLIEKRNFTFFDPKVFGQSVESRIERSTTVPAFRVDRVENATIGNARIVLQGERILLSDTGALPDHYGVAGQREYLLPMNPTGRLCIYDGIADETLRLDRAFLVSGRVPKNYFHWLIEYLPKLLALRLRPELNCETIPILVDSDLPKQIVEALRVIQDSLRFKNPVLPVNRFSRIEVGELHLPTNPMHLPDRFDIPSHELGGVSEEHSNFLRDSVLNREEFAEVRGEERIFLSRKAKSSRGIVNIRSVEEAMNHAGFRSVYPETLTFLEQVRLFRSASVIIGPGGAGFSNVLFCRPGTRIISFVSTYNRHFPIFSNLARIAGADYQHVLGHSVLEASEDLNAEIAAHSDYRMDPETIRKLILTL